MECSLGDELDGGAASNRDEYATGGRNDDCVESSRMNALDGRSCSLVREDEHCHRSMVRLHHEMRSESAVKPTGLCIRDAHDSRTEAQPFAFQQRCQFGIRHDIQGMNE